MKKALNLRQLQLGVCYYPEQWPEALWADDMRRMQELGFSVIRMAEFAWTIIEPEEGHFSFTLFDRVIDLAHTHGLQVILGTPTATPPAWLTHRYPEVLNTTQAGVPYRHGMRRHYSYNSPMYQEFSARVTRAMAEQYANHPAVIGWQIDNELNCEVDSFYAPVDHVAFRAWARKKYGSLDALNQAWGTVFWSQTYTDWQQVGLTGPTPSNSPNPHQALDEKRFFSDSAITFARLQAEILRQHAPRHWVTTNGLFGHLDSHRLTDELLDFIAYDSYPNFGTILPDQDSESLRDRKWGWKLSVARSISPTYCVMEQQAGAGGWTNRMAQPAPKPGQLRLWTYQSIAHGADMVLYFRWRTATAGTEIYWHGLNDYHNRPNRRIAEAARVTREIEAVGGQIAGSLTLARVALLCDYDNEWDGELDCWHGPLTGQSLSAWWKALQHRHIPADALYLRPTTTLAELTPYTLLVYPHPAILSDSAAALLSAFVQQGGTVIFGARTGYKDLAGQCPMRPLPGPVAQLCGITIPDFTRLEAADTPPALRWHHSDDLSVLATGFNDILQAESSDVEVLAEYADGYYAGAPAVVQNRTGRGSAYYYGAAFTAAGADALVSLLHLRSPVDDWLELPPSVELCIRQRSDDGTQLIFLLNYSALAQPIIIHRPTTDLLSGQALEGSVQLEAYGVWVLVESGRGKETSGA